MAEFVFGAEKIAAKIHTIRRNTGIVLGNDQIKQLLLKRTLQRFDRQVDPDGKPWPPASAATKRRNTQGGQLLFRSGQLRNSIAVMRGGASTLRINTGASGRIGVQSPEQARYGSFHQYGIGVPQRRFLGVSKLDVKAVDSLLYRAIIRASGLR